MRAVELRIVFEDDDGKTYTETYEGTAAENAFRDLSVVEMERQNIGIHGTHQDVPRIGPVLRRVTEVRACHYRSGYDTMGLWVGVHNVVRCEDELLPSEVHGAVECVDGPLCDYRIEVTAVPVPEVKP